MTLFGVRNELFLFTFHPTFLRAPYSHIGTPSKFPLIKFYEFIFRPNLTINILNEIWKTLFSETF